MNIQGKVPDYKQVRPDLHMVVTLHNGISVHWDD